MLLNNINNKEIPKLCFEIMSIFYKEPEILEYIDILIKILVESGTNPYTK